MKVEDFTGRSVGTCGATEALGAAARRIWDLGRASSLADRDSGAPIRATVGAVVEAVACVTTNVREQVVVVDHILRTRGARCNPHGTDATR